MSWQIGLVANGIIMVAYLLISISIVVPLARSGQLRTNPLGGATAAIFFSCAVHHGAHTIHMLVGGTAGEAMKIAWTWPMAISDIFGAAIGVYYWTLRRTYASLMEGAQLFQDLRLREQQALELNDSVLQGLVVAKMALDLEQPTKAREALATSIDSASRIITDLLGNSPFDVDLRRSTPAMTEPEDPPTGPPTDRAVP
ncbi:MULTISPECIES: hypothetical protein [unclassified Nocardioides]|uniref:hypothetical protein n=1 Tax=unclassified Nocardioides TaxID=2615069 RepID=UPI003014E59A